MTNPSFDRERAEAEFSWASIAEQTLGVYESVRR